MGIKKIFCSILIFIAIFGLFIFPNSVFASDSKSEKEQTIGNTKTIHNISMFIVKGRLSLSEELSNLDSELLVFRGKVNISPRYIAKMLEVEFIRNSNEQLIKSRTTDGSGPAEKTQFDVILR